MNDVVAVVHHSFVQERAFSVSPERVFAAWRDPAVKRQWFAWPEAEHELDFRVGGFEILRTPRPDGPTLVFESRYLDIVEGARLVYSSRLYAGDDFSTASITSVEFRADGDGDGTLLVLTESDVFLDGREQPDWREQGTADWLGKLGGIVA